MQEEYNIRNYQSVWSNSLSSIAEQPLEYCPNFPEIAQRWENWWQFKSDCPLLIATAPKKDNIRWDKAFDLIEDPQSWFDIRFKQMENTYYTGDAIPNIRIDLGPVLTAAFLGAPMHFSKEENTSWQIPNINEWNDSSIPCIDTDNHWFKVTQALLKHTAEHATGKYLVSMPDLASAFDILANMRGTEKLLMDIYDNKAAIIKAADKVVNAWEYAFTEFYDIVIKQGVGLTSWLRAWSNESYTVPTCDFNYMISCEHFSDICMPSISEQAKRAGRCIFHLDGPGASKHAETLAKDPFISVIQYTPGTSTPSAMAKIEMLQLIQSYGKPIIIITNANEVPALINSLDHRGLAIIACDIKSPKEADELLNLIENKGK